MKTVFTIFCLCLALLGSGPVAALITASAPPLPRDDSSPSQSHGSMAASAAGQGPTPVADAGSARAPGTTTPPASAPQSAAISASVAANSATNSATNSSASVATNAAANAVANSAPHSAASPPATAPAAAPAPISNLFQVILALIVVLLIMFGCAWLLKNHGPRRLLARVPARVIGGVNLGGRERILVVEVADQWLVVGSTPTQINLLTTLPRQESIDDEPIPGKQFSVWLKQVMEKRNG
jgi:flagellar protein FliO/FliZ